MALKNDKAIFIEVKQPNGVLSEIQKIRIKQLREQNFDVFIWTDYQIGFKEEQIKKDTDEMWF